MSKSALMLYSKAQFLILHMLFETESIFSWKTKYKYSDRQNERAHYEKLHYEESKFKFSIAKWC